MMDTQETIPGALRIARITFPDGTAKDVLQQAWITKTKRYDEAAVVIVSTKTEWRDVPLWHVPYESPR